MHILVCTDGLFDVFYKKDLLTNPGVFFNFFLNSTKDVTNMQTKWHRVEAANCHG